MALFLSTYSNKVDKKGRVSVPANFRSALGSEAFKGIIAYKSFINDCIEACDMSRIEMLSESIDELDPYSDERDAFATAILGGSVQLPFDKDGRVMLPDELMVETQISEKAVFVGKGKTFEIWNPDKFTEYSKKAKEIALAQRGSLRLSKKGGVSE